MLKGFTVIFALFLGITILLFGVIIYALDRSQPEKTVLSESTTRIVSPTIPQAPAKEFQVYKNTMIPHAGFSITVPDNWILWYKTEASSSGILTAEFDGYPTDVKPPKEGTRWGGLIITIYPPVASASDWMKKYMPGSANTIVALKDRKIGEVNSYVLESKKENTSSAFLVLTGNHSYLIDFYKDGRQGARERTIEDLFSRFTFQ